MIVFPFVSRGQGYFQFTRIESVNFQKSFLQNYLSFFFYEKKKLFEGRREF